MPTEIFEDALDVEIGLLEAENISRRSGARGGDGYPFPALIVTDRREARKFRTVILENPFLRVTLVPALGGRILSLFDRRTSTGILPVFDALLPVPGGRRGAFLPAGVQLRLDGEDRLASLGVAATMAVQAEDDESPGGVWVAETALANGLGFHLFVSLPPDRAQLRFEARISNRTFRPLPYDGELAFAVGTGEWNGSAYDSDTRDAGFHLGTESPFDGVRLENGILRFARFGVNRWLAPRQVDAWTVTLTPFSGLLGTVEPTVSRSRCSAEAAARFDAVHLRLQTTALRLGHKLVFLTADGQTFETPVDLYPEHMLEMPLDALPSPPVALVLLDPRREEVLRVDASNASGRASGGKSYESGHHVAEPEKPPPSPQTPELELRRATFDVASRHLAHTALGIQALGAGEYSRADGEFEHALLYNASDPLLWWAKAFAQRLAGAEEESGELLNAHFLAPLEPALRAEAFLRQPLAMVKEPSPLLEALNENPEEFVEVACLLIEHGRLDQAHRWLDEALRHRDLAMLRLLTAYCLLMGTQMVADAAEHVRAAGRIPGPPYPWRPVELNALRVLQERFPDDAHLSRLIALVESPAA